VRRLQLRDLLGLDRGLRAVATNHMDFQALCKFFLSSLHMLLGSLTGRTSLFSLAVGVNLRSPSDALMWIRDFGGFQLERSREPGRVMTVLGEGESRIVHSAGLAINSVVSPEFPHLARLQIDS
jgi:hypothetical protein